MQIEKFEQNAEKFVENNYESEKFFAKVFSKQKETELFYELSDTAYTDGKKIYITPEFQNIYQREDLFLQADKMLGWSKAYPKITFDIQDRLYFVNHALLIHECLHILYTDFTIKIGKDIKNGYRYAKLLAVINNIIEDAYIEAAGSQKYRSVREILILLRTLCGLKANSEQVKESEEEQEPLTRYMNYIIQEILYPVTNKKPPKEDIKQLIKDTLPLFYEGIKQPTGKERYEYSKKILELIQKSGIVKENQSQNNIMKGLSGVIVLDPGTGINPDNEATEGEAQEISQDIFKRDLSEAINRIESSSEPQSEKTEEILEGIEENKEILEEILKEIAKEVQESKETTFSEKASEEEKNQYEARTLDKVTQSGQRLKIVENKYTPLKKNATEYLEIKKENQAVISYFKKHFMDKIKSMTESEETGYKFGKRIDSRKLADNKKRYWTRTEEAIGKPEIAIAILIDGSGSMQGKKNQAAKKAAVIMHEILEGAKINHFIGEFRTIGSWTQYTPEHNIIIDFGSKPNDKYNILRVKAQGGNRDGLALRWTFEKLQKQPESKKVIIIISDGIPTEYESQEEAHLDIEDIQRKATKKRTPILAIALEENSDYIYNCLKGYYKNIIKCNKPDELPKILIKEINKQINR